MQLLLAAAVAAGLLVVPAGPAAGAPTSSLVARAVGDLDSFTRWLGREPGPPAHGFIGEVGWPGNPDADGDARWNEVARAWYAQAARDRLWVAAWAAGDFWSPAYKLLVYATTGSGVTANPQAAVVESQRSPRLRGINVAGPEFASPVDERTSAFSNEQPGVPGTDYVYPSRATLEGLAARGIGFVRLPVRWERLQPHLGQTLDAAESARLTACLERVRAAGLRVVLDVHNYGAYYLADGGVGARRAIGSAQVGVADFADLWRRLSSLLAGNPTVLAYGLMNEPTGMAGPGVWERASRAAVAAIRGNGDPGRVLVQSYGWGGVRQFARLHRDGPWIADRGVWYEAHQYFDADGSARYVAPFDLEARGSR